MNPIKKLKILLALNKAHREISMLKTGWKTTEFWMSVLSIVGGLGLQVGGLIPGNAGAIIAAVAGGAYQISRGLAKAGAMPTA